MRHFNDPNDSQDYPEPDTSSGDTSDSGADIQSGGEDSSIEDSDTN